MSTRFAPFPLALVLAVIVAMACGPIATPGTGATTPAPAASAAVEDLGTVRYNQIQAQPWYWDVFVAEELGLWKKLGLTVERSTLDVAGAEAIKGLLAGQFELQSNAFDVYITTASVNADTLMLGFEMVKPEHGLFAQRGITSIAQLKGKKIGIGPLTSGTTLILRTMLRSNGLQDADYQAVQAGPGAAQFAAMQSGAIDATLLVHPQKLAAQSAGFTFLGDASQFWDNPFLTVGGRKQWIEAHPKQTVAFLQGLLQARTWLYAPANRAAAIDIAAKYLKVDGAVADNLYKEFVGNERMAKEGRITETAVRKMGQAMIGLGAIKEADLKVQGTFDPKYLEEAIAKEKR